MSIKTILIRRIAVSCFILWTYLSISLAGKLFVSTTGNDATGTLDSINLPYRTISKAISVSAPGDTIFVRGGVYEYSGSSTAITIPSKTGSSITNRCCIIGYNGERPLLDFTAMTGTSADGIKINGSYWYLKNLDLKGAPHNGLKISEGSYNIIELCNSYENRNTGVQLASGASYNSFINCDSYNNRDAGDGNADGFAPKLDVGTGNYFYGCRAWQNSDDGWDGYVRPSAPVTGKDTMKTIMENCWSFTSGYLKNGSAGTGNGNGFKLGGGDEDSTDTVSNKDSLRHNMTLINCLAFMNLKKGFDQNNNRGTMTLINCTGYQNGSYNFAFPDFIRTGEVLTLKNCISLLSQGIVISETLNPVLATNSWPDVSPYDTFADAADFISIDTTGVCGPRKADGSLPDISFMHLAPNSKFVNKGTDIGLPYSGSAPDLGCFESNYTTGVNNYNVLDISDFQLYQNYPNPFNPKTVISYKLLVNSKVSLRVFDILGREIATLVNEQKSAGTHRIEWDGRNFAGRQMSSGVYFYQLKVPSGFTKIQKMLLLK